MASAPLRATSSLQDDLLEELAVVTSQVDPANLRIVGVSRSAERLLGHPLKDWTDPAFLSRNLLAADRNALAATVREVAETGDATELVFALPAVGLGSTFRIYLPVATPATPA